MPGCRGDDPEKSGLPGKPDRAQRLSSPPSGRRPSPKSRNRPTLDWQKQRDLGPARPSPFSICALQGIVNWNRTELGRGSPSIPVSKLPSSRSTCLRLRLCVLARNKRGRMRKSCRDKPRIRKVGGGQMALRSRGRAPGFFRGPHRLRHPGRCSRRG